MFYPDKTKVRMWLGYERSISLDVLISIIITMIMKIFNYFGMRLENVGNKGFYLQNYITPLIKCKQISFYRPMGYGVKRSILLHINLSHN